MNYIKNKQGIALIFLLIILIVVATLVFALLKSDLFDLHFKDEMISQQKAFYLADAGAERLIFLFRKSGKKIFLEDYEDLTSDDTDFIKGKKRQLADYEGFYQITNPDYSIEDDQVSVDILGSYSGSDKKIGLTFDLTAFNEGGPFNNALFAASSSGGGSEPVIKMSGSAKIDGDIKTNATAYDEVSIDPAAQIAGDLALDYSEEAVTEASVKVAKKPGDQVWSPAHGAYRPSDGIVWYNGFYYKAKYYTTSAPDADSSWSRQIPAGEAWPWFKNQTYNTGDEVWYNEQKYVAKYNTTNDKPADSAAWERMVRNVSGSINNLEHQDYPDPEFPDFPADLSLRSDFTTPWTESGVYTIAEDGQYNNISVTANRTLTIDLNNSTRIIRVNNLNLNQGHIVLTNKGENGRLILYVGDEFTMTGSSDINYLSSNNSTEPNQIDDVMLYYAGDQAVNLSGSTHYYGNIFIEKADLNIGGGSGVMGNIISRGSAINISGGTSVDTRIIYALDSKVDISGGAYVEGTVMANSFNISGGTTLKYEPSNLDSFPFADLFTPEEEEELKGGGTAHDNLVKWYNN